MSSDKSKMPSPEKGNTNQQQESELRANLANLIDAELEALELGITLAKELEKEAKDGGATQ